MTAMRVERQSAGSFVAKPESSSWQSFDIQLAFYALALAVIGLVVAWSNSTGAPLAAGSIFTRGLMWFAIAILAFTLAAAFDYRWLRTFSWLLYLVNIGLLLLTMVIGVEINGAQRWISVAGLTFQFSEISKVLMMPDSSGCFLLFDNSAFFLQGHHDNYVVKITFPEMEITKTIRILDFVLSVSLSPDGRQVMVQEGNTDQERLRFFDAATLKPIE